MRNLSCGQAVAQLTMALLALKDPGNILEQSSYYLKSSQPLPSNPALLFPTPQMGLRPSSEPRSNRGFTVLKQFAILARKWFAEAGTSTPWLLAEEKVVPEWPMGSWEQDSEGTQGDVKV